LAGISFRFRIWFCKGGFFFFFFFLVSVLVLVLDLLFYLLFFTRCASDEVCFPRPILSEHARDGVRRGACGSADKFQSEKTRYACLFSWLVCMIILFGEM
jgi:hypothetical protein